MSCPPSCSLGQRLICGLRSCKKVDHATLAACLGGGPHKDTHLPSVTQKLKRHSSEWLHNYQTERAHRIFTHATVTQHEKNKKELLRAIAQQNGHDAHGRTRRCFSKHTSIFLATIPNGVSLPLGFSCASVAPLALEQDVRRSDMCTTRGVCSSWSKSAAMQPTPDFHCSQISRR